MHLTDLIFLILQLFQLQIGMTVTTHGRLNRGLSLIFNIEYILRHIVAMRFGIFKFIIIHLLNILVLTVFILVHSYFVLIHARRLLVIRTIYNYFETLLRNLMRCLPSNLQKRPNTFLSATLLLRSLAQLNALRR